MKRVTINGDMTSDRTSEQYPTVTMCDGCIAEDEALNERSNVVAINGDAGREDGPCIVCDEEA